MVGEIMSGKTVEGRVESLKHIWRDGPFQQSNLLIRTKDRLTNYDFYALVPDLILGEQIVLYQQKENGRLFQKLTLHPDSSKEYQVSSSTLV